MTFDELANLPLHPNTNCFLCGEAVTPKNYSGTDQIVDGQARQPLCQNCYVKDDVAHLDDIAKGSGE